MINWTGLPAHKVFSGILLPAGTVEFGAITQPLSNWQPYITTDLKPICALSSIIDDLILHECSIFTLLPMFNDNGNAYYGAQCTVYKTVLSPILVFYPILTA